MLFSKRFHVSVSICSFRYLLSFSLATFSSPFNASSCECFNSPSQSRFFNFSISAQFISGSCIFTLFPFQQFNTQFNLKAEQYLLKEKGVKFEMIRHFRYCSIGFYAMKAEHAKMNGGFRFQVALPPYKYKRKGYIPRVNTSANMGIVYNAGNERYYYRQYKAEVSDNIMEENSFNPYFIKSELLNF